MQHYFLLGIWLPSSNRTYIHNTWRYISISLISPKCFKVHLLLFPSQKKIHFFFFYFTGYTLIIFVDSNRRWITSRRMWDPTFASNLAHCSWNIWYLHTFFVFTFRRSESMAKSKISKYVRNVRQSCGISITSLCDFRSDLVNHWNLLGDEYSRSGRSWSM